MGLEFMLSAQERAYERLRSELRCLRLKPETRINIAETAETLDVSTIPLREALVRLAAEGLVERVQGGFHVPGLSVANVEGDFSVIFLFMRHAIDVGFHRPKRMPFLIDHVEKANSTLRTLRGDPDHLSDEAETFVRNLLPVANSAKLRNCVEAALDASTIYRRAYYREMLDFESYVEARSAYAEALRHGDETKARSMVTIAQRDWEGRTRELCRHAWVELYE